MKPWWRKGQGQPRVVRKGGQETRMTTQARVDGNIGRDRTASTGRGFVWCLTASSFVFSSCPKCKAKLMKFHQSKSELCGKGHSTTDPTLESYPAAFIHFSWEWTGQWEREPEQV